MRTWMIPIVTACLIVGGCRDADDGRQTRFASIGTGGVTGVYYPAGGAIAKLVNEGKADHGVQLSVESTGGSVFNINAVLAGDMDFGIAQSDRQYQALRGLAEWKDRGPQADLRAVCSLHPEVVTLVAAADAGIRTLADLKGKRINIGSPGSGNRGNALDVLRAAGIDPDTDLTVEGLKAVESAQKLQDGRIDAFFYTVGHPASSIMEAASGQRRKVRLVPITGMDKLLAASPYYTETTIPIKHYPELDNTDDVPSIGVVTTIVTSAKVPDHVVHAVTQAVFDHLDRLREMHPALSDLTKEGMLKGLSAPIHPGALRYFEQVGLK